MNIEDHENDELGDNLKALFKNLLGVNVNLKNNFNKDDEQSFLAIIEILDNFSKGEETLIQFNIDMTFFTSPLWQVIEYFIGKNYGLDNCNVIMWYIFDRFDTDGNLKPFIDNKENEYKIEDTQQLWNFITKKS
jgi:hypothetical protein